MLIHEKIKDHLHSSRQYLEEARVAGTNKKLIQAINLLSEAFQSLVEEILLQDTEETDLGITHLNIELKHKPEDPKAN